MEIAFLDVHQYKRNYENALASLQQDQRISTHNRELVTTFCRDAALGKTVIGRARKKIGPARLLGYVHHLSILIHFIHKDVDALNQGDMERFIEALEQGVIGSRSRHHPNQTLSMRYRIDVKVTIRKFYKWLWGNSKRYPEIVEWIDTYIPPKEIPALSETEVATLVDHASRPLHRALIQCLFDGGFRLGEILNVRLCHVVLRPVDDADIAAQCFFVRVPFSKTLPRTVVLPMEASTKWLRIWLGYHPGKPHLLDDGTISAQDTTAPLFPVTAGVVLKTLKTLGARAIRKRVYPHLMRHTSATYWSNRLPYFKFCKRFGWTMTSKMPQRYIDREGVDELEVAKIYRRDQAQRQQEERRAPPPSQAISVPRPRSATPQLPGRARVPRTEPNLLETAP